ncbi:MAG TPA: hypothetical protein VNV62_24705 [Trebonia sp.]|nr:hypothetical protein [Trebonia sp.]
MTWWSPMTGTPEPTSVPGLEHEFAGAGGDDPARIRAGSATLPTRICLPTSL